MEPTDSTAAGGALTEQTEQTPTIIERAAQLRELADEASDFGGLRKKLDKVAAYAEAVAAELARLRADLESVRTFHEEAALEVAQRLDQLDQAVASRPA